MVGGEGEGVAAGEGAGVVGGVGEGAGGSPRQRDLLLERGKTYTRHFFIKLSIIKPLTTYLNPGQL